MIIPLAELDPALVVEALSTIPEGSVPSVKEEPHSDCRAVAAVAATVGKS